MAVKTKRENYFNNINTGNHLTWKRDHKTVIVVLTPFIIVHYFAKARITKAWLFPLVYWSRCPS